MPRKVISELRFPMKAVEFKDDREGGFLIGNCDIAVDLQGMVIRIVPPLTPEDEGEAIILNNSYTDSDFEDYMGDELDDIPFYFSGTINGNVPKNHAPKPWVSGNEEERSSRLVQDTVWRFFTNDVDADSSLEEFVLLVSKTQPKESLCTNCKYSDGEYHHNGEECPKCKNDRWFLRKPDNSQQVKVTMMRKDIKRAA